jgi:hypothetical protein
VTLKVLVIGRVEEKESRVVSNGHTLEFTPHAGLAPDFLSPEPYSFVFMHLGPGNREARPAISKWVGEGWAHKVIGFSGGHIPTWCAALPITTVERLPSRHSFLELHWGAVRTDFSGPAAELLSLLSGNRCDTLVALAVLCQGYLSVHAVHTGPERLGEEPDEVLNALSQMGWDEKVGEIGRGELESWAAPSGVGDLMAEVSAPAWWRKVWDLGEGAEAHPHKWAALVARLEHECARRDTPATPGEIGTLLEAIQPTAVVGAGGRAIPPDVVSRAYTAITGILSK